MTLNANQSLHPVLKQIKTATAKQGVLSWRKNMAVSDAHIVARVTPVNKGSVRFHWLFLLYTFIQSLTSRSCVASGLLTHISIPGALSFQSSKIVQEYWVVWRELPSDSNIPCPPCWTVIVLSVVNEFWVYSVRSPCFIKEDSALGSGRTLLKNVRQKAVSQKSQPVPPELSWGDAQWWYFCWVSLSLLPCYLPVPDPCMHTHKEVLLLYPIWFLLLSWMAVMPPSKMILIILFLYPVSCLFFIIVYKHFSWHRDNPVIPITNDVGIIQLVDCLPSHLPNFPSNSPQRKFENL